MKYLTENENWDIVEDYNIDKLLYLLIDKPDEVHSYYIMFLKGEELHRDYGLPAFAWEDHGEVI